MNTRIEAVFLQTTRLSALAEFYQAGFELKEPQPGDEGQLGFQLGEVYFALEQVSAYAPPPGAIIIWFRVENVIVVYNQLLKLGAKVKSPPLKMESEIVASVFDPDGNAIGLIGNQ